MKTTRDLSFLFSSSEDDQIEAELLQARDAVEGFVAKRKGTTGYLRDPNVLKEALDEYSLLLERYPYGLKSAMYFSLLTTINDDAALRAKESYASNRSQEIFVELNFFPLSLGSVSEKQQEVFLRDTNLSFYRHYLEETFKNAQYTLSEGEEKVLTLLSNPAYSSRHEMVSLFFAREKGTVLGEELSFSEILSALNDTDKEKRDSAARVMNRMLVSHSEVAEHEMNAILEYKAIEDKLRGFTRVDQSALVRDSLDGEVLDAMVAATEACYPLSHRFYRLKAQLLGYESLEYHERNVPYVSSMNEQTFTFDQGVAIVRDVFAGLDQKYAQYMMKLLETGMVDVFPRVGKRSGACNEGLGARGGNMILLNRTHKLEDVTTLAHELGHAINIGQVAERYPGMYFGYGGTFLAEVASTFFENFVFDELLSQSSEQEKLGLLMHKLNTDVSTLFRQLACYTFERELHMTRRGEGRLSKEQFGSIFQKHMRAYMGDAVQQSPGSQNRWIHRPHIRTCFYTYVYTGGLLLSNTLRAKVYEDSSFISEIDHLYFSAGNSSSPQQIFADLGFDITNPSLRESGYSLFEKELDLAETLAGKL